MSSQQLIANELLAFIQNAIDTMDEVSILQICKSNFKEDDICSGKALLFQSVGKADQMPSRRRDGGVKSLQDIITLFKETDPDHVPSFVAKELYKLPPVTFDHVDVTRLLKDITSLKSSLAEMQSKLEISDKTISELRTEMTLLRNTIAESRLPEASKLDTCSGTQTAYIGSTSPLKLDASPVVVTAPDSPRPAASCPAPTLSEGTTSRKSTTTPRRAYAAAAAANQKTTAAVSNSQRPQTKGKRQCLNQTDSDKDKRNQEGFTVVEKKKRKPPCRNKCGTAPTGPNHLLRPAIPSTLLYVSRLHYSTTANEIVEYIRIKTKFNLRVERLQSRHSVNFNSFVVRVPTEHLSIFEKEEFWPKGVIYRKFRGRIPDTTNMCHTSQTTRVS